MRRCSSTVAPMWRRANGSSYDGSGMRGLLVMEGTGHPPPLSAHRTSALQRCLPTVVLLPERFRGGVAPSAPPDGGLSHAGVRGDLHASSHRTPVPSDDHHTGRKLRSAAPRN